nr:DUF551 domain-containing protein [Raoultella ornithinolytica]
MERSFTGCQGHGYTDAAEEYIDMISALRELQERRKAEQDSVHKRNPVLAYADSYRDMAKQGVESVPIWSVITDLERNIAPLYRHAQPVTVVPDRLTAIVKDEAEYVEGWNACRTAMLAAAPQSPGSEPSTVPGKWIPVSERMPEDSGRYWCYVEEQNDLGKSHYQWNCSWNGDRWWVESEGGGIVTHWMPLPAAPQEVKGE